MGNENFFDETTDQSVVKATIVEKYFQAWAKIIASAQDHYSFSSDKRIGYIDLFAGPGRYKDGSISTPVRVLQTAAADPQLAARLVTIFNDKDPEHVSVLRKTLDETPELAVLTHKPVIWNLEVGDQIAKTFQERKNIPILAFIDPWGYKGLTLRLVDAFLKDWGCDCIFFFNYARINAGLNNPMVHQHMCALFGEERAVQLRTEMEGMTPPEREATIVNGLAVSLKSFGHRFVLPFCFKNERGTRSTHHLILVTKAFKGYEVMKEIMAKRSSSHDQGVPSFTYSPATGPKQQFLFELNRPLDDLKEMLLKDFAGKSFSMRKIYEQHSVDRPYLSKNYKEALASLEKEGLIQTSGRKSQRGFADEIIVTFPQRKT